MENKIEIQYCIALHCMASAEMVPNRIWALGKSFSCRSQKNKSGPNEIGDHFSTSPLHYLHGALYH